MSRPERPVSRACGARFRALAGLGALLSAGPIGAQAVQDSAAVQLSPRRVIVSPTTMAAFLRALQDTAPQALHGVALLRRNPTPEERAELARRGVTLLPALSGRIYRVRVAAQVDTAAASVRALVAGLTLLQPADRVAPPLWAGTYEAYRASVPGPTQPVNYAQNPDGTLKLTVFFQADTPDSTVARVLEQHTHSPRRVIDLVWLVTASSAELRALAAEDVVRWIGPGAPPFRVDNDVSRGAMRVDELQNFNFLFGWPEGLSGRGVQAGVYDSGIDQGHDDFKIFTLGFATTNRIKLQVDKRSVHGTMVAGVLGGSGRMSSRKDSWNQTNPGSPWQWRGMAPLVELLEVFPSFGSDGAFNFDGAHHLALIRDHGMDISNHTHQVDGDDSYGPVSSVLDGVIRGDATVGTEAIPRRLQVFSAGNQGVFWYLSMSKQLKNALVVGNWNVGAARINGYSSLGPADDGRTKPDVVGPGTYVRAPGFWDPGNPENQYYGVGCLSLPEGTAGAAVIRQNFYATMCGTSLAAPAATGVLALVLEQFAATYQRDLDNLPPWPSTLRGLAIHGAQDAIGTGWSNIDRPPEQTVDAFPGPDYPTGYGLLDAVASVELVKSRLITEATLGSPCQSRTFTFPRYNSTGVIGPVSAKVTLTWDDLPGDPALAAAVPKLVNDLDLVLIDPDGNKHYPWQLNQKIKDLAGNPLTPAQETCGSLLTVETQLSSGVTPTTALVAPAVEGTDHLNNVEQAVASGPEGTWQAVVTGYQLTSETQRFSLIGVPRPNLAIFALDPSLFCAHFPAFCFKWMVPMCVLFPELCTTRTMTIEDGVASASFRGPRDRIIVPLRTLCGYLGVPDACTPGSGPVRYSIRLGPTTVPLGAVVYDSAGAPVAGDSIPVASRALTFTADPGQRYILMLIPPRGVRAGQEIRLPMRIGSDNR